MFYKSLLFLSLLFFAEFGYSQVDSLGLPTIGEKASIQSVVYTLEEFLQAYSSNKSEEECKQVSLKLLKQGLSNPSVSFPINMDTSNAKRPLLEYAKRLQQLSVGKWSTSISITKWNQLGKDKLRNKYFTIVFANLITTIESVDANGDTLEEEKSEPLLFYFRFDKIQNISSHFRLFDIIRPDQKFALEPLPECVEWWLALDKPWQDYFRKYHKMPLFPPEVALLHLLNKGNLSLEKARFCQNLSPLKKFTKLHVLNFRNSNFSDFKQLKDLRFLQELYLEGSDVKSFDGLDTLKWLRILYAPKLGISSIEPLKNVINLIELNLSENDIEDISVLKHLKKLQKLDLSMNEKIKNVQVLARMRMMNDLSLAKIDIKDLSILKDMVFLDKLNIFNTGITSLEPLRTLTKLSSLNIGFNVVHTLEPIKGMFFLQHLNVAGTAIKEMDVLGKFIYLKSLDCSNNPALTALGSVVGLDNLEELKCFSTKIDKNEVQHFKKKHPRCRITYY